MHAVIQQQHRLARGKDPAQLAHPLHNLGVARSLVAILHPPHTRIPQSMRRRASGTPARASASASRIGYSRGSSIKTPVIRGRPIDPRHLHIIQSQVHAKLPAMMHHMVQRPFANGVIAR